MNKFGDGGPAFPSPMQVAQENALAPAVYGMSLRDWLAGMAMAGSLGGTPGTHLTPDVLARDSYAHADAMLRARADGARR